MSKIKWYWYGDSVIELIITNASIEAYRQLEQYLITERLEGIREFVITTTAMDILVDPSIFRVQSFETIIASFEFKSIKESKRASREISVCYHDSLAIDLKVLSQVLDLSESDIISLHIEGAYQVEMFGFMPGFPYMSGLPKALEIQRKSTPSISIPAGSVAIAGNQCGIYPFDSPGGWYVIGRTPEPIVDMTLSPPFLLELGMNIKFSPITLEEFDHFHG